MGKISHNKSEIKTKDIFSKIIANQEKK